MTVILLSDVIFQERIFNELRCRSENTDSPQ
jgi:hypothetical protein